METGTKAEGANVTAGFEAEEGCAGDIGCYEEKVGGKRTGSCYTSINLCFYFKVWNGLHLCSSFCC